MILSQALGSQLPVIQRPMDNTALSTYLACPREYFFAMMLHRRSSGDSPALSFGSAWHHAMETHYKTGGDMSAVADNVMARWEEHSATSDYRTMERVLLDYNKYTLNYGKPEREQGKTVGFPDAPLVEIATNARGGGLLHPWAGKLDRIIELGGLYYVEDHKTTSRLDKHYFKQFELSYQMKGYTYLAQQLLPEYPIAGVRINLSHVLTGKTEFHRQIFSFTKDSIQEWIRTTNAWMIRLADDIQVYENSIALGRESMDAMIDAFPAHFGDNGCSRKFGMCQFHPVCSTGPRIRGRLLERDYNVRPWNPLEVEDAD